MLVPSVCHHCCDSVTPHKTGIDCVGSHEAPVMGLVPALCLLFEEFWRALQGSPASLNEPTFQILDPGSGTLTGRVNLDILANTWPINLWAAILCSFCL